MGTRHLICVVHGGEFRVAQYGQWDGHPSGQGEKVLTFLLANRSKAKLKRFADQVAKIKHLDVDQVRARWTDCGAEPDSDIVSMDVAEAFAKRYPHLNRDCGGNILNCISKMEQPEVSLDLEFAADSLFCEFAYVIDLDKNVLEIFKGFNEQTLGPRARFKFLEEKVRKMQSGSRTVYYPVKLLKRFKFEDLTVNTMKQLDRKLNSAQD